MVGGSLTHWLGLTHLLLSTSMTIPEGHSQPCQHFLLQINVSLTPSHVWGQENPHSLYTWPSIGQAINIMKNGWYSYI